MSFCFMGFFFVFVFLPTPMRMKWVDYVIRKENVGVDTDSYVALKNTTVVKVNSMFHGK